jgi:endonuclease YncB( thermonuclease family)
VQPARSVIGTTRRHILARWLRCGAAVILLLSGGRAHADIAGAPRVIDGRTLEVAGQRIRLFGIDAPDLDQVCEHGGRRYQCGSVARAALWDLIAGLDVSCAPEADGPKPGGTTLAVCTAGGRSLNESLVQAGWALADRGATDRYVAAEAEAKAARRGLWKGAFEPPWEWRRAHASDDAPDPGDDRR